MEPEQRQREGFRFRLWGRYVPSEIQVFGGGGVTGGSLSGGGLPPDATTQRKILSLLCDEGLTPKQAFSRLKISKSRGYRLIKKLKEKGLLKGSMNVGWGVGGSLPGCGGVTATLPMELSGGVERGKAPSVQGPYRLHGERWRLELAGCSSIYREFEAAGKKRIEGHLVIPHREVVEVNSCLSFYGATQDEAEKKSEDYWPKFFSILTERLGTSFNVVERTFEHYAYMNSEIARRPEYKRKRLSVVGKDGKVWFLTDGSLGKEDETIGKLARPDRRVVDGYLNDWREKNPPKNSELAELLKGTLVAVSGMAQGQEKWNKNFELHYGVLNETKEVLHSLDRRMEEFASAVRKEKKFEKEKKQQRRLDGWE